MKELLIKSYIKSLTKDKIIDFALKNDIILNDNELDFIYLNIKNNYNDILNNPLKYLNIIKSRTNPDTYNKIYELYSIYYPKLYH